MTETSDRIIPKPSASPAIIFLEGIGRFLVLSIILSISLSNHMLIAPEAPAPKEIQKIERTHKKGWRVTGDKIRPLTEVKTANDMTLGLRREMKSSKELWTSDSPKSFMTDFELNEHLEVSYLTLGISS